MKCWEKYRKRVVKLPKLPVCVRKTDVFDTRIFGADIKNAGEKFLLFPCGVAGWSIGHGLKAFFQIDFVAEGDDGTPEHHLFVGGVPAHIVHGVLDAENKMQDVFQLVTYIIVGLRHGVGLLLQYDKLAQGVQTEHVLGHGNEDQIGDLVPAVLLPDRIAHKALFDIIADHGGGNGIRLQRRQIFIDILHGLLQVQPHRGNLLIPGQPEIPDTVRDGLLDMLFHKNHLGTL